MSYNAAMDDKEFEKIKVPLAKYLAEIVTNPDDNRVRRFLELGKTILDNEDYEQLEDTILNKRREYFGIKQS